MNTVPPTAPTGAIDGRAIQAQFASLTSDRDKFQTETSALQTKLSQQQSQIHLQRQRQLHLSTTIQSRTTVLGESEQSLRLLIDEEKRLRRQYGAEGSEIVSLVHAIAEKESAVTESKTSYYNEMDGWNDELDAAMNRYDEGRIVGNLTVGSIAGVLIPKLQTMVEAESMTTTTTVGGPGTDDDLGDIENGEGTPNKDDVNSKENDASANGTPTTANTSTIAKMSGSNSTKAKQLQDLSDRVESSLNMLKDATSRVGTNGNRREEMRTLVEELRKKMMQGRNRDGRLFSELDLNDLESRWEAEYHATKTDYDVADVDVVHDGDGAEEEGGLAPNPFNDKSPTSIAGIDNVAIATHQQQQSLQQQQQHNASTASMELFYSAASNEDEMMMDHGAAMAATGAITGVANSLEDTAGNPSAEGSDMQQ